MNVSSEISIHNPLPSSCQHVPYGYDVAHAARQNKEMEEGVHISMIMHRVKESACNVGNTFSNNPACSNHADVCHKGLEGNQHTKSHQHETYCLHIAVFLQMPETHESSY